MATPTTVVRNRWRIQRLWAFLKKEAHSMEFDPHLQWLYHRRMTVFWLINFPIVALLFFGFPTVWIAVGLLLNTFYSLYANFDTEFGDAHSAFAAWKSGALAEQKVTNQILGDLLQENTELTKQIHDMTTQIKKLVSKAGSPDGAPPLRKPRSRRSRKTDTSADPQ